MESSACRYACAGDAFQTCGGLNAINIYEFDKVYEYEFVGCFGDDSAARVLSGSFRKNDATMTAAVSKLLLFFICSSRSAKT